MCGLALCAAGRLEPALRACDFFQILLEHADEGILYINLDAKGRPVKEVDEETGGAGPALPVDLSLFYRVDSSQPKQLYFFPGVALTFLCDLHGASGEKEPLDLADGYFAFLNKCQADVKKVGKVGWGSARYLDHRPGNEQALKIVRACAKELASRQRDDGSWSGTGGVVTAQATTAEFVFELIEMARADAVA